MLEWKKEQIEKFGYAVANLIADYVGQLETAAVFPNVSPEALERLLASDLDGSGRDPFELLEEVRTKIVPHSMNIPSPNYYGLINPAPTLISVFAESIAGALNQNLGAWGQSPAATMVEKQVVEWLCQMVGYRDGAFGTLTSGGTLANVTALKLALSWKYPEVAEQGITALGQPATFYVSEECHFSLDRAVDFVGVGRKNLRKIPSDEHFRVRLDLLESAIARDLAEDRRPCGVIGIAGTTSTGNVDPLKPLAEMAQRYHLWYHVDAAYGGPAVLSKKWSGLLDGLGLADSITIDPHKWLFVPNFAGAILVKNRQHLRDCFFLQPAYVPQKTTAGEDALNFFQYGVLGTRRFDALKVWLSLRHHGLDDYGEAIDRQIALATGLAELLAREPGWEVVHPIELAIVCARYTPPDLKGRMATLGPQDRQAIEEQIDQLNSRIQRLVQESGKAWLSTTRLKGRTVLRINVISYRTREEHIHKLIGLLKEVAANLNSAPIPELRV